MKITTLPMFVLVMGILFIGFYSITDDFAGDENYAVTINSSYKDRYGDLINYDDYDKARGDLGDIRTDKESQYFTGAWDAIKSGITLIYDSFEVAFVSVVYFGEDLGIPAQVQSFIVALLILMVIGTILYMLLRVKQ